MLSVRASSTDGDRDREPELARCAQPRSRGVNRRRDLLIHRCAEYPQVVRVDRAGQQRFAADGAVAWVPYWIVGGLVRSRGVGGAPPLKPRPLARRNQLGSCRPTMITP